LRRSLFTQEKLRETEFARYFFALQKNIIEDIGFMNKFKGLESDHYLLFLLLALFIWSGHSLYFKPFSPFNKTEEKREQLGVLEFKKNIVKLKSSGVMFWQDTIDEAPLYADDSIYTYEESGANLKFKGGVSLSLGPKTLFKVTPAGSKQKLEVKKGIAVFKVEKGASGLSLDMNGKNVDITGDAASIRINQNAEGSNISLVEGTASIQVGDKKLEVSKNQRLFLGENQEVGIETIPVELEFPKSKHDIFYENIASVDFRWKNVRVLKKLRLQISTNIAFSSVLKEIPVDGKELQNIKLGKGNFFWRIIGIEKNKLVESNTHVLNLIPELPPAFYFPQDGDVVNVSKSPSKLNPQTVVFKWENQDAEKYNYEIQKNGSTYESGDSLKPNLKFDFTSEGEYAIRIQSVDKRRPGSKFSRFVSFKVQKMKEVESPEILNQFHDGQYFTAEVKDIPLELRLDRNEGIAKYTLKVARDQNFSELIFEKTQKDSTFKFEFPELGKWYLRIGGIDHFERALKNPRTVLLNVSLSPVELLFPKNAETITLKRPDEPVALQWRGVASLEKSKAAYRIEISRTEDFEKIIDSLTSYEAKKEWIGPELGKYYWRVIPENSKSKSDFFNSFELVKPEPPKKLKLPNSMNTKIIRRPKPPPRTTSLWSIFIDSAYAQEMENVVPLTWPISEEAEGYKIQIFEDNRMGIMLHEAEVKENSYDWVQTRPGFYYLRVAVVDGWGQVSDYSDLILVRVNLGEGVVLPIQAPKLLSPYHTFEPDEKFEKPLIFKWEEVEDAESYHFMMAKSLEFDEPVYEKTLPKGSKFISIPREEVNGEGSVRWRVYSVGKEGQRGRSKTRIIRLKKKLITVKEDKESKIAKEDKFEKYWWLVYATTPGSVTYELTDGTLNVNATGNILNGANEIYGGYKFKEKWDMAFKAIRTTATFFEDTPFTMHSFALQVGRHVGKYWKIRFGPRMVMMDFYEKDGNTSIAPSAQSFTGAKINFIGTYNINEKWSFYHDLILGVVGVSSFDFDAIFHYQWSKNLRLGFGVGLKNLSASVEEAEVSLVKKQLLLSIGNKF